MVAFLWPILLAAVVSRAGRSTSVRCGGVHKDHHEWMKQQLNVQELWGFGLHGDGVPCNYDRTQSCMLTSINLPGLTGKNGRLRIPLVILPDSCFSENTFDDVMGVIAWDLSLLLTGCRAECRHDQSAWDLKTDQKRSKLHGDRGFRACLVQVRSDWDWLTKCYHFPGHGAEHNCWLCQCKRSKVSQQSYFLGFGVGVAVLEHPT